MTQPGQSLAKRRGRIMGLMPHRRVVTGIDEGGRAIFVADGVAPRSVEFASIPGMHSTLVWATEPGEPMHGARDATATVRSFHPKPGATRFLVVRFPPDSVYGSVAYNADDAAAESEQAFPGLAELFELDAPGMHTTESIDYAIVLAGEPVLELDDGAVRALRPGDVVVQNGTRHAWRNPTERPAEVAFVLVGASR